MQRPPITGRTTLDAGMDRQRPNECAPPSHKMVAGMTIVTMPGSRIMARMCLHIAVARPTVALFVRFPTDSAPNPPPEFARSRELAGHIGGVLHGSRTLVVRFTNNVVVILASGVRQRKLLRS